MPVRVQVSLLLLYYLVYYSLRALPSVLYYQPAISLPFLLWHSFTLILQYGSQFPRFQASVVLQLPILHSALPHAGYESALYVQRMHIPPASRPNLLASLSHLLRIAFNGPSAILYITDSCPTAAYSTPSLHLLYYTVCIPLPPSVALVPLYI